MEQKKLSLEELAKINAEKKKKQEEERKKENIQVLKNYRIK